MPVVESGDSRSASSSNESDNEEVRSASSRHHSPSSRSNSPPSHPHSPTNGPRSPDSQRSRSRSASRSNSPKSRSGSPDSASENGPRGRRNAENARSPSPSARSQRSRSNSASSREASRSPRSGRNSRPATPKSGISYQSDSRPHSRVSTSNSPTRRIERRSPASSRENSPGNVFKASESPKGRNSRNSRSRVKSQGSDSEDNLSIKSKSSRGSRKSVSSRGSRKSRQRSSSRSSSRGSRRPRRRSRSGSESDSSVSSVDSCSRKNKDISRSADTKPEDISDGDMESENEKQNTREKPKKSEINISHEDLSDVSDLEDSIGGNSEPDNSMKSKENAGIDTNQKKEDGEDLTNGGEQKVQVMEKKGLDTSLNSSRHDEGEEQLDFEAEDGECEEVKSKDGDLKDEKEEGEEDNKDSEKIVKEEKELEEGEVTDEDDARPEETEPRPVCRFFSRGACTWGASCRFLHPGVTDKGNYTMFDMVRPILPGEYGMGRIVDERLFKPEPPLIESAWERGLRTAKEMLKKSMRRKEQDIDFEEKKMNLSIAQEEFDKENGYYGRIPSPEPRYVRHIPEYNVPRPPPEEYYGRRPIVYEPEYAPPPRREHPRPYREMPPPRGPPPDYYSNKYEEEPLPRTHERPEGRERERDKERRKPKREVIVQRAEKEERPARADEWQDPWMRSKSPGRRKDRKRSYSSGSSSYSSSSTRTSSPSSKSSYRSRSRSAYRRGRSRSRHRAGRQVSPSVIVSERKAANERAALMNPPAPKRRAPSPGKFGEGFPQTPQIIKTTVKKLQTKHRTTDQLKNPAVMSPGMMRVSAAANPPAPSREEHFGRSSKLAVAAAIARVKGKTRRSSRSSSGTTSGSSSDSDSSESSSSSSRSNSPPTRDARKASEFVKAIDALKGGGAIEKNKIKLNLKNPPSARKADLGETRKAEPAIKKRPAASPPQGDPKAKKATSRREELLKQLKAVEDAIAKKRSKV